MSSPKQMLGTELPKEHSSPAEKNHEGAEAFQASVHVYKNDISPKEVANFYSSWAADYEKVKLKPIPLTFRYRRLKVTQGLID